ncbi:MAG: hydrogenase nickel incorporation protein HypB [Erysipelotrichales bacterium]|nr:hydrogenase nickel incorporation protein HypB [Erysipelotrichales bacterium]
MVKIIKIQQRITSSNDTEAEKLRMELRDRGIFALNLMSSPGSGKSTFLKATAKQLKNRARMGVLEADIDSAVDAEAMAKEGITTLQLHTDGMCHVDADMMRQGLEEMDLEDVEILFLENVGNLICPAEFDTGCHKNVMILSVPEGDDKPLKYPLMFSTSDAVIISKLDTLPYFDFSLERAEERIMRLNPKCRIFPLSAKTGEGMSGWIEWLIEERDRCFHD